MAWIYLFLASIFEMAWTFSLRFLSIKKIKAIHWQAFFSRSSNWGTLAPLLGYIVFGLGSVYCLSQGMKEIPASTALAVWLGTALVGVKLIEIFFFKMPYDVWQFLFIGLILVGIAGLKKTP